MRLADQTSMVAPIGPFISKVAIVLAMVGAALATWVLREVIIILFGALVLSNGMSAMARFLGNKCGIRYAFGLLLVVLIGLSLVGTVGWFFGATIIEQLDELTKKIPDGLQWLTNQIEARPYVRDLFSKLEVTDFSGPTGWIAKATAPILKSFLGTAGSLVVMAIVSIYLAGQPQRYRSGVLRLLPSSARMKMSRLFDATAAILGRWLVGQLAVMAHSRRTLWTGVVDSWRQGCVRAWSRRGTDVLRSLYRIGDNGRAGRVIRLGARPLLRGSCDRHVHWSSFHRRQFHHAADPSGGDLPAASSDTAFGHLMRAVVWPIGRVPCGAPGVVRHHGHRSALRGAADRSGKGR